MDEPRSHQRPTLCVGNNRVFLLFCVKQGADGGSLIVQMWSRGSGGATVWGQRSQESLVGDGAVFINN